MPSSINASTTAGLVNTADTSGVLQLQTAGTTAISIDASQAVSFTNSPTVTGGTANGVAYLNGSKVLTTGSALVFDGTNLGVGVTPQAWSLIKALQLPSGVYMGSYTGSATPNLYLGANNYFNGTNFIYSGSYAATKYEQTQGAHSWFNAASGTAGNAITFTQAMTLDASGNLGIGTTSPSTYGKFVAYSSGGYFSVNTDGQLISAQLLDVATAGGRLSGYSGRGLLGQIRIEQATTGADGGYMAFGTCASGSTAYTERARIDSSGNLLVGTTNTNPANTGVTGIVLGPTGGIRQSSGSGASYFAVTGTSGTHIQFYTYNAGAVAAGLISSNGSTTSYTGASDYRLKENIAPMTGALAKVAQLNPVTYKWKLDGSDGQGFIAHELQTIFPDAVVGEKDALNEDGSIKPQGVDTSFLVATLTAAIQEQQALITQLTARITALESA